MGNSSGVSIPPSQYVGIWKGGNALLRITEGGGITYTKTGSVNQTVQSSGASFDEGGFWIGGTCGKPMLEGMYSMGPRGTPVFIVNDDFLQRRNHVSPATLAQLVVANEVAHISSGVNAISAMPSIGGAF